MPKIPACPSPLNLPGHHVIQILFSCIVLEEFEFEGKVLCTGDFDFEDRILCTGDFDFYEEISCTGDFEFDGKIPCTGDFEFDPKCSLFFFTLSFFYFIF